MSASLLDLPPELLIQILTFLPLRSLLQFSQVSHNARLLACSNLRTISLNFCDAPKDELPSTWSPTHRLQLRRISAHQSRALDPLHSEATHSHVKEQSGRPPRCRLDEDNNSPSSASVRIPDSHNLDYATLTNFQTALARSVVARHSSGLQNLDLTAWALTTAMAQAIARVSALRTLSIRLQHCPYTRSGAVPRSYILPQRREERKAWDVLAACVGENGQLRCLRIENTELDLEHVVGMVERSRSLKELALGKCSYIGKDLWRFLGGAWAGRESLEVLRVSHCGGMLDETGFAAIGALKQLKHLDVSGCYGARKKTVEALNQSTWRIPCILPPQDRGFEDQILEVDPAYC